METSVKLTLINAQNKIRAIAKTHKEKHETLPEESEEKQAEWELFLEFDFLDEMIEMYHHEGLTNKTTQMDL